MKQNKDQQLYFIALIPPEPVFSAVQQWKEYFAKNYQSKAALRSPPHITLHMPFRWQESKEELIVNALSDNSLTASFEVDILGFGCFKPRTIFLTIENSKELNDLFRCIRKIMKTQLSIFNADHKSHGYHPHLTLAFRDLKKPMFKQAWEEFKEKKYEESFMADSLTLLKHNGKVWEVFRTFTFG